MANQPSGGPGGGRYSYAELEGLWIGAGGPKRLAPLMAAIAMAESRGIPGARNPSGATGLWQILGQVSPGNLTDPQVNARNAVRKWQLQGLKAWTTYTSGDYKHFLKHGVAPVDPSGGATGTVGIPYGNPLRGVKQLKPERIDMGVDYAGEGPVYALGEGVITSAGHAWRGAVGAPVPGTWITERLTSGPLRGRQVYVAEDIYDIRVRPGQHVTRSTVLGTLRGGLETGLAAPGPAGAGGTTLAAQLGEASSSGDPGATPSAAGVGYANVLAATGAPRGIGPKTGGVGSSSTPPWLAGLLQGLDFGTGGNGNGGLGGIAQAISSAAAPFQAAAQIIDFLLLPTNWVRIVAGVTGGLLAITGIFTLSHVGGTIPGTGMSARPAALPVGIGMTGLGAVLLFVAFHNLPGEPGNLTELLGSLRDEAQQTASGQKAAA